MTPNIEPSSKISDDGYDIVISGMSGKFPSCDNIKEYGYHLYNKISMITNDESRWIQTDRRVTQTGGKLKDLAKFDANFFGVNQFQANYMDPQARMLLEESFKAIADAGVNPFSLRDSRTGVYIGACYSETEKSILYGNVPPSGFGLVGCSRSMFANRISFTFGFNGPSLQLDTACSSSMFALNLAFQAMEKGEIDAAIVGGCNLCLHPNTTLQFYLLGVLSPTDTCKPFDAEANGYVRSEAVSCIFLQRKSAANRIYATVINSRTNCDGFKQEGITYPSGSVQENLLRETYDNMNFNMNDLGYLEAHSTGTVVGDPAECAAIDNAICSKRTEPLLVGSVKSNCGHAEPASGMCSLVKVLLAFQNNIIPPNLNFNTMRDSIDALKEGRLSVVSEPTRLVKPYIGVNSFGFGGANAHAIMKRFEKEKNHNEDCGDSLPRLVTWPSRTEDNAKAFFDDLLTYPLDKEYLALIHNAQLSGIRGMIYRGFSILQPTGYNKNPISTCKTIKHYSGIRPPLVWVFSGMGSQWVGMGKSLMTIPLFRKSIQRCHTTLKPTGIDLVQILTSDDPHMFDNILHSFVGIAAIQIAIVDILRALDLTPDYIIGHSVGELGCSYADNCFTAEQMILAAYYRGKVSIETMKIRGAMAAIGMGAKDIKPILPTTIDVACHNSADSCTISGPCKDVDDFVKDLMSKNVFAKVVPCSNIAYHSQYIAQFGPELLKYLQHIIPDPKIRSNKWISSSVPQANWSNDMCRYSSPEYHTNNLLNSVLFEEAAKYLPKNAVTIEIAPHALLQSILKTTCPEGTHIGLTRRRVEDSVSIFLQGLGNLYNIGVEINLSKLYPEVQFPVSRGTRSISHLIDFDHTENYYWYSHKNEEPNITQKFPIDVNDSYLVGHEIDGRVLVPATFYLECVWSTFSNINKKLCNDDLAVEFEEIQFLRATTLAPNTKTELVVVIHKGTGNFEITESQSLVALGTIREISGTPKQNTTNTYIENTTAVTLNSEGFYKELKLRGYHYKLDFQAVTISTADGLYGKIKWIGNWVTFMDCMLQLSIVGKDSRSLMLPTKLRVLRIYPRYHQSAVEIIGNNELEVFRCKTQNRIVSGGIEIIGLEASTVERRRAPGDPVLEKYQFVSHFPAPKLSLDDAARCCIQLLLENCAFSNLNIIEQNQSNEKSPELLYSLKKAVEELPLITGSYSLVIKDEKINTTNNVEFPGIEILSENDMDTNMQGHIIVVTGSSGKLSLPPTQIDTNGFVLCRENENIKPDAFCTPKGFIKIAVIPTELEVLIVLKKLESVPAINELKLVEICSTDLDFKWMDTIKNLTSSNEKNIILVAKNDRFSGILGLTNCLRKEPDTSNVRCMLIDDPDAPPLQSDNPFYAKQLELGLAINVYQNKHWGTYRHLLLPTEYPLTKRSDHVFGNILHVGDLSSIAWVQGPLKNDKRRVKVLYSGLNFKDVMLATGRLSSEQFCKNRIENTCVIGMEYSGIDLKTGKLIMGMILKGAIGSYIEDPAPLYWEVPSKWSLRDAAAIPVVYLTVYLAFFYTADIRKGKSILIHAGTGGVGLAAIRVALAYGLNVFTTVSTKEKKAFLLDTYPELNEKNIGNSRDTSFEDMIMDRTDGEGVDFVLNSLSEDKLLASIRCLGEGGTFLEIGKFDMSKNNKVGLGPFLKGLSFHAVMADKLITAKPEFLEILNKHIKDEIAKGIVQPLPSTVFEIDEIEQAFRYIMTGKHIGKVVIQIFKDAVSETTLPIRVMPRVYFSKHQVYIIPGGLGGFGLELVDWMALRGARKFVLSSRRGLTNDYQKFRINLWKSYSCQVQVNTADIRNYNGCLKLVKDAMKLGPIGGIFNLAVLLRDSIFSNQSVDLFRESFEPKAIATMHLDKISRQLCPHLQHFVIFSSVSCGRGNAGQTNYGMANSIMERIIESRISNGLPGKAIQWGAVGEVGLVAEMAKGKIDLEIGGTLQQRISSCLHELDALITAPDAIVCSMVVAEKKANSSGQSPLEFVLNIMSIRDIKLVSMSATFTDLGMDSLMAVEIKQVLERDYDIVLSTADLRSMTFAKLSEYSVSQGIAKSDVQLTVNNEELNQNIELFYGDLNYMEDQSVIFDHVNQVEEGIPAIIITGIDGCSGEIWRHIGQQLKMPAYVLQVHVTQDSLAIDKILDFAYDNISQFLIARNTKKFRIIGYSLGAMFSHMVIPKLESNGYHGSVVYIDGSPAWIQSLISVYRTALIDDTFHHYIIGSALRVFLPNLQLSKIQADLKLIFQRDVMLQYVYDTLQRNNFKQIENAYFLFQSVFKKILILCNPETYTSIEIINSPVLLLKSTIPTIRTIDEDYGFKPYCRHVDIQTLIGDHRSILNNQKLPDIINHFFNN